MKLEGGAAAPAAQAQRSGSPAPSASVGAAQTAPAGMAVPHLSVGVSADNDTAAADTDMVMDDEAASYLALARFIGDLALSRLWLVLSFEHTRFGLPPCGCVVRWGYSALICLFPPSCLWPLQFGRGASVAAAQPAVRTSRHRPSGVVTRSQFSQASQSVICPNRLTILLDTTAAPPPPQASSLPDPLLVAVPARQAGAAAAAASAAAGARAAPAAQPAPAAPPPAKTSPPPRPASVKPR